MSEPTADEIKMVYLMMNEQSIEHIEAIQRVRELHWDTNFNWCSHCQVSYPCQTIQALDGEQ